MIFKKSFKKISNFFQISLFNRYRFSNKSGELSSTNQVSKLSEETLKKYNHICKLNDRGVISVGGEDATNFLQGLITNDMKKFEDNSKGAIFTLFLSPKGRILYDGIIVKSHFSDNKYPEYWLDVDSKDVNQLIDHLNSFIMRKKVYLQDMSNILGVHSVSTILSGQLPDYCKEGSIWKELQDTAEYNISETDENVQQTDSMSFFDPRHRCLGSRIICPGDSLEIELDNFTVQETTDEYHLLRTLYGIPEGRNEVNDRFPLNLNFHHLNGISFSKGCYIGQELTQRTYHTGVIRKSIMVYCIVDKMKFYMYDQDSEINLLIPITSINREFKENFNGKEIKSKSGEVIGTTISSIFNAGLAIVDKEKLESAKITKFEIDGLNVVLYDPVSLWEMMTKIHDGSLENEEILNKIKADLDEENQKKL